MMQKIIATQTHMKLGFISMVLFFFFFAIFYNSYSYFFIGASAQSSSNL